MSDAKQKKSLQEVHEEFERELEQPSYIKDWLAKNTFHHSRFKDVKRLVRKKKQQGVSISLCFPTLNEEKTVGKEITLMRKELMERHPLLDEIAVVDSGSTDKTDEVTRRAGAEFYYSGDILPQYRFYRGKGENLWKSLYVLKGDIICWIDADITNIHPRFVLGLIGPLLEFPHLLYVKAFYKRPINIQGELHYTGGGRVTELVVRPFFNLLFPELTGFAQPLSGEYAGRRELLERLPFFTGYGVESGHLIDVHRLFGLNVIGQCDLDVRIHRNQPIESLRSMSYRILKILLQRADDMGRIEIFQDISDSLQVITGVKNDYSIEKKKVWGIERPPMITIHEYRERMAELKTEPETLTGDQAQSHRLTLSDQTSQLKERDRAWDGMSSLRRLYHIRISQPANQPRRSVAQYTRGRSPPGTHHAPVGSRHSFAFNQLTFSAVAIRRRLRHACLMPGS